MAQMKCIARIVAKLSCRLHDRLKHQSPVDFQLLATLKGCICSKRPLAAGDPLCFLVQNSVGPLRCSDFSSIIGMPLCKIPIVLKPLEFQECLGCCLSPANFQVELLKHLLLDNTLPD